MELKKIAELVNGKARLYNDPDLVFAAQELELYARVSGGLASVEDAADYLALSVDWVWKLVAMGEIKSMKIGKRRLIRRSELDDFIRRRERAETPEG